MSEFFIVPSSMPVGGHVGQLQQALRLLVERGVLLPDDEKLRRELCDAMQLEQLGQVLGNATRKLLSIFQEKRRIKVSGILDELTADALNRLLAELLGVSKDERGFVVKGKVSFADGFAAASVPVVAVDLDLRSEEILGRATTNRDGEYEIRYSLGQFRKLDKGNADLRVRALRADGTELAASSILFNAPAESVIDLTIGAGEGAPSLFERIAAALQPALGVIAVRELEEDGTHQDLAFLAGETRLEKPLLARYAIAHRLTQPELPPEFWFALLGGSVFTYDANVSLPEQAQTVLTSAISLDSTAVRRSLNSAFTANELRESLREQAPAWTETFLSFAASRAAAGGDPSFLKDALQHAGLPREKGERFARLFTELKSASAVLDAITSDPSFQPAEVADLRTSFRLADLTGSDFSVVRAIKETFDVREPEQIRNLAKKGEGEWIAFAERAKSSGEVRLPLQLPEVSGHGAVPETEAYGKLLTRQFRDAFPTAAFAGGLERALQNGGAHGVRQPRNLMRFIDAHQDFELLNTPVDDYLDRKARPELASIAGDPEFRLELKAVQRVFKLVPSYEATDVLLADGIHSSQQIYRMGQAEFVNQYADADGFTALTAQNTWNRAADTYAGTVTLIGDLTSLRSGSLPAAIQNDDTALSRFPNWNNLFQSGDLCECEHCRSVLSPAAYFTDLLMFLRDRNAKTRKVKDVVLDRRPDLGYIELNCENALTPFPYIDTVCEVLEAAVAKGASDVRLTGFTTVPATNAEAAVDAALLAQSIRPGTFTLSQVKPGNPDLWVVHGDTATYLLKKKPPATPFFAQVLRNTKASAAELRAYPQYVDREAYEILRAAKYPLALPFDLFAEEVRATFQKANLQRWELMQTFRETPITPSEAEVAAEYFGISVDPAAPIDELRLIADAKPNVADQQARWGESGANWLDAAGNVSTFLRRTNLEYNDLLALLDLASINPAGDIAIHHDDATCDTARKWIRTLDATKLDRIHRFLRLWRKLPGWKSWEVDLVLRTFGGGQADDRPFLVRLFYFSRLRKRLGDKVGVEELTSLFAPLNVRTRFTKLHEKRADAHYQSLFLNKRLINPADPAFALDAAGTQLAGGTMNDPAHAATIQAVLGLSAADLETLRELTKASAPATAYIDDALTLTNVSFLWRHAWLPKLLKLKIDDWTILLRLIGEDVETFTDPAAAWEFVEKIDQVKAAGIKPDTLSWLLAADRDAKSATKEQDAIRFLTAMRKDLQAIAAEHDPAAVPAGTAQLTTLLTSLLGKLNRDEAATSLFLRTLEGRVVLETTAEGIPAGSGLAATITGAPNHIPIVYDEPSKILRVTGLLSEAQKTILVSGLVPAPVTPLQSYIDALDDLVAQSNAAGSGGRFATAEVSVTLPAGVTLPADRPSMAIRYDAATNRLTFIGLMTVAERTALIAAGYPVGPITELFDSPRLAVKFYEPFFSAPLDTLPPAVDFKTQLTPGLAAKISFDPEQRLLRFAGIMTAAEQLALNALAPNVLPVEIAFHAAVDQLANDPLTIVSPDTRVWMSETDLDATLTANDTIAKRLANASKKALAYLSKTLSGNRVITAASAPLGLTEAMTRRLLDSFALLPPIAPALGNVTLLAHLTREFAPTSFVVDRVNAKDTIDGWYWAIRAAALLRQWKVTLPEWESLLALTANAQLLDFGTLPLDSTAAPASLGNYLRAARLLRLRDTFPEDGLTFLALLVGLEAGTYPLPHDIAADAERVTGWKAQDVEDLINTLDAGYPPHYLLAETWERMRRAFAFAGALNAGIADVQPFAAATMNEINAKMAAQLLRSKLGSESWLTLATEIQDVLRERKRDALVAYLLTQPPPADAPSGKWQNTNDLYAYYLLDVEMCPCQLTSRLVQASGSLQLFVMRCFMGLEPEVEVNAGGEDGDSAWRWWKWMRNYRVWEANRKVYLWPENWIEPELKKDRSPFFKDLENTLQQNEITQDNVEVAFASYLEKLDGVGQLEIAGFFQEDDGDLAILHVFGRTRGAEPHLYYYRRYDFRQWSPWEAVELEIRGDYLIPAVVNKRLFLFWPIFTEVPDENTNKTVRLPKAGDGTFQPDQTTKALQMQMAVSDYRQGKWTPKRVSTDAATSTLYTGEITQKHYTFYPIDRTGIDGRFGIKFEGTSVGAGRDGSVAGLAGAFEIGGCRGVPELASFSDLLFPAIRPEYAAVEPRPVFAKWLERPQGRDDHENDFALENTGAVFPTGQTASSVSAKAFISGSTWPSAMTILRETPGIFSIAPPWHLSYMDRLLVDGMQIYPHVSDRQFALPVGTWLPFFYADKRRTFFVPPVQPIVTPRQPEETVIFSTAPRARPTLPALRRYLYYPEVRNNLRAQERAFEQTYTKAVEAFDMTGFDGDARRQLDLFLYTAFPLDAPAPLPDDPLNPVPRYTAGEIAIAKSFMVRWWMRYIHLYLAGLSLQMLPTREWHFKNFYHPFVCDFAKLVNDPLKGIPGLMDRKTQFKNSGMRFGTTYQPTPAVIEPGTDAYYPKEDVDFTPDGAYSSYNWELFFHAPLLIANSLSRNQRFEEAREWYHFIFNPLGVNSAQPGGSPMSKYWITRPFYEATDASYIAQRIDAILRLLSGDTSGPAGQQTRADLEAQVLDWKTYPFEPHRIANYRRAAYQKNVVMKYLDNLIAWGDNLFRQDTMESANEATQLYIMAAEILGERPRVVPPRVKPPLESFNELESQLDGFANALVQVENVLPPMSGSGSPADNAPPLPTLYFCIPQNDKMLAYWDLVADRLYKLRHCMNIEGVVRSLALFEPPIDPGALVKAVAGGVDLSSAIADLNAPLPLYRFTSSLQKANEICNDVKALGSALLSTLEKKDGEAMALLRQTQELRLLTAIKALRETQLDEARTNVAALENQKKITETRRDYYRDIERTTSQEKLHIDKLAESHTLQETAQGWKLAASIISYLPEIKLGASGFGGTPMAAFWIGGVALGKAASLVGDVYSYKSMIAGNDSGMASARASYDRRWDDWKLQERLAERELVQIDTQIASAKLRVTAATKELANQELQIENSAAIDAFMKSKYTNEELYLWQIGQISGVYFQSYRLAYDLAKRAERCFRFELGVRDTSFINFGYWDSLKKGLLSGEKLQYDLRQMESAYMEQNRREFELTKHVSLAMLDPLALVKLRETGRCFFRVPEELFDLDYPGHYFRRIKSVSITLPCVTGPYTTIACTLRLLRNSIRSVTTIGGDYGRNVEDGMPADDDRFVENNIPVKAIATSTAQNDSGVFELQFRDERYLPFEGAGAISEWSLELFNDLPSNNPDFGRPLRQFDYDTISDAIVHVRYTAREDAGPFKNKAVDHLREYYEEDGETPSLRMLSLRHDFPTQWHRFLHPADPANGNVLELEMSHALFPFRDSTRIINVNSIVVLARCTGSGPYEVELTPVTGGPFDVVKSTQFGGLHFAQKPVAVAIDPAAAPAPWKLTMKKKPGGNGLTSDPAEVDDIILVMGYDVD
jgi:Tc toxin complex TcA C-terminal TcB-binding domain/Neuraminidase-like domain/Salmonella virulence plasmid 28.1kDa A protein